MAGSEVRTEYLNIVASLQPEQAINLLNDRVTVITKINGDIADWLLERRKVEEAYVTGLRKLARRPQQDAAAALGIFQMPWQRIVSGTENLAASHETLAMKIETDVETPLRSWTTRNRGFKDLSTAQLNLSNVAKELSGAQKKAAKGGRRADTASSTVEDASRQWESQAPYVFEQLQVVDEARVNHLRDVLTQFATHEVDSIEKDKASAESCLGSLLNVETADEITTFAARATTSAPPGPLRRLSSATGGSRPNSSLRTPPAPPPPRGTADGYNQRQSSFVGQDRLGPLPDVPQQKEKSKLAGLKRLGTVINRRKSTAPPVPTSTEEKRRTRFVPFRRGDSSRSFQDLEESGENLTPTATQDRPPTSVSHSRGYEQPDRDLPEPPLPVAQTNGFNQTPNPLEAHPTGSSYQAGVADTISPPANQASNNPYEQALNQANTANTNASTTQTQQAFAEASAMTSPTAEESARNFMIRDKPIEEDQTEAQEAMNLMANQLRSQGVNRVQGSVRGRRDVRNTMYVSSSTEAVPQIARAPPAMTIPENTTTTIPDSNTLASPLQRPPPIAALHDEHIGSDTASMMSSRSLAVTQHPDLHDPGLSASVVETVHSTFTESGISKSFVLGEIALSYNASGTNPTAASTTETVRIQNFELLDKVAANPIFLSQLRPSSSSSPQTEEQAAGSYTVTTTQLRRPTPMICLKYQLHMEESNLAQYSPILLTPAWQIIDGQVSVIVLYSLNPVFGTESLSLKNVSINVGLDTADGGARAQSAMMAPTGGASFRRKTSSVLWRLPEFVVKAEQERLLVRFITTGMAKKGTVEIKFEIVGRTASGVGVERLVSAAKEKDGHGDSEDDPFADEGMPAEEGVGRKSWEAVPCRLKLVGGRYVAT